jgi:hypothetical protein
MKIGRPSTVDNYKGKGSTTCAVATPVYDRVKEFARQEGKSVVSTITALLDDSLTLKGL